MTFGGAVSLLTDAKVEANRIIASSRSFIRSLSLITCRAIASSRGVGRSGLGFPILLGVDLVRRFFKSRTLAPDQAKDQIELLGFNREPRRLKGRAFTFYRKILFQEFYAVSLRRFSFSSEKNRLSIF
jgi:hypothetical protein